MSEPKRIALTTLVSGSATEGAGSTSASKLPTKKDKKNGGDGGAVAKTQRFTLTLPDSTEKSCPEFNFADLTAALPKKKENHVTNGTTTSSSTTNAAPVLDPYAEDDEDQLRNIAKKFEEKYGLPVAKKKKSRKYDEYVDLGAGYDETDPFIDNTDAYDEIVPAEVTTAHGGFYINSGALEFKPVEKRSDSDSESESSSSESESDDDSVSESSATPVTTGKKRRIIDSDSDEDSSSSEAEIQLNGKEPHSQKKKTKLTEESAQQQQAKRKKLSPGSGNESGLKKARPSVKELLQQKREKEAAMEVPNKLNNTPASTVSPTSTIVKDLTVQKKEVIEPQQSKSVATTTTDDASSDSSGSSSDSSDSESGGEEEEEDNKEGVPGVETKLPNNLTAATLTAIEDLKKAAASSEQGKCRFFSTEVNRLLLAIELQARQYSCSKRQAIYTHLAGFLPCTKHTLLKRAKNLVLEDVDAKLKPAIRKLQSAVEKVIGEQIERHATQCQRLAEANPERYLEYYRYVWDPDLEPAGGTDEEGKKSEKSNKQPQPRRRFQWSKEIRSILNQVVYLKAECFHWSKLRKESASEYLIRFLDTEIRQLWPKGWMTAKILFKESSEGHSFVTSKTKVIPGTIIKKPTITPRTGLVDTLAPPQSAGTPLPNNSLPVTPSIPSNSTPSVAKEVKKSQLKDRMMTIATATVPATRPEVNSIRNEQVPSTKPKADTPVRNEQVSSVKPRAETSVRTEQVPSVKPRTETSIRTDQAPLAKPRPETPVRNDQVPLVKPRPENNGTVKSDAEKHRQRSDPTCSAARTEIHRSSKVEARQNNPHRSENHSVAESHLTTGDVTKFRNEAPKPVKASDPGIGKTDPLKVNKVDSKLLTNAPRESNKSRPESEPKRPDPVQPKVEAVSQSEPMPLSLKTVKPSSKVSPITAVPAPPSMASFVDSGIGWKEEVTVLDLTENKTPKQGPKMESPTKIDPPKLSVSTPPKAEDLEDQESLLQRDLDRVLEEITQITHQVEEKEIPKQPPAQTNPSEWRTKSVIKVTGRASPTTTPLTSTASPKVLPQVAIPPKVNSAISRVTPPPPPSSSPSLSRISPTGATKTSISGSGLNLGSLYASNSLAGADYLAPPTAHSSGGRHHLSAFYGNEHISPEKRIKSVVESFSQSQQQQQSILVQHQSPPLPAHQQVTSTSSIARSSPNTIFRNYPTSASQLVTTPSVNSTIRSTSSHSIESLMQQTKKSSTEPLPAHRPMVSSLPPQPMQQPPVFHLPPQLPPSLPKHDPSLSLFVTQKNSQTNPHGSDYTYYSQTGTGHHQHSS